MAIRYLKASVLVFVSAACGGGDGGGSGGQVATAPVKDPSVVGTTGGVVTSTDGRVSVTLPAGAVSGNTKITISKIADDASEHVAKGSTYEFGPSGTQFAQPVELKLPFDPATLAPGVERSALQVARRGANGEWTPLGGIVIDSVGNNVRGLTTSFSSYGVTVDPCRPLSLKPTQGIAGPYSGTLESGDCKDNGIRADVWQQFESANNPNGWGEYELTSTIPHRAVVGSRLRAGSINGQTISWYADFPPVGEKPVDRILPSGGTTVVRVAGGQVGIAGLDSTVRGAYTVRFTPMTSRQITSGNGCSSGVYVEEQTSVIGELSANGDCAITIKYSPFPAANGKTAYADYFWIKARPKEVLLAAGPESSDTTTYGTTLAVYRNGQVVTVQANRGRNVYRLDMRESDGVGHYLVEVSNGTLWQGEWRNPTTAYSFSVSCVTCPALPGSRETPASVGSRP